MDTGSVTIRAVDAADRSVWADLWRNYLAFYETTVDDSVYDATFTAFFKDDPHHPRCLLAVRDGRIIGLVHFLFHAHCWRAEGICYLQDLFVVPMARGTGAGRALIMSVYQAADARGVPNVYWMTQDFNHTARKLYDSVGQVTPFLKYMRVI